MNETLSHLNTAFSACSIAGISGPLYTAAAYQLANKCIGSNIDGKTFAIYLATAATLVLALGDHVIPVLLKNIPSTIPDGLIDTSILAGSIAIPIIAKQLAQKYTGNTIHWQHIFGIGILGVALQNAGNLITASADYFSS